MRLDDPAAWIAARSDGIPSALMARIDAALRDAPRGTGLPDTLRGAADALLEEVRDGAARDEAVTLLAADALITFACEAVSERDPAALTTLA